MTASLRRVLPRTLLGRSLLILLVPLVLVQGVTLFIFYGSHLDLISRRLAGAVAGEVALTTEMLARDASDAAREQTLAMARDEFEIAMRLRPGAQLAPRTQVNVLGPMDDDLRASLAAKLRRPFHMDWTSDPQSVLLQIQVAQGVLDVEVPRKRLYTSMIYVFVLWMVGTAVLLYAIAALFMRNQVRAIRRLAKAAEAFGMGRDQGPIRPEGAVEVRRAATAFNRMQERIRRFLAQRTEMLAGVSHDLRTPLTRLRLALAMQPAIAPEDAAEMTADLEEMERMIEGYLAFARGETTEQARLVDLSQLLDEVCAGARRAGARVSLDTPAGLSLALRPVAVRRAVTNLVDNARRHGRHVALAALPHERGVLVTVDDDGPGVPAGLREDVFRAFQSGAAGGTGLGLTIARDIVRAHGGDIVLEDSPLGGLRACIRLPA
ncbi:MAG: ATP-binding protein [Janthinobacterium lividum]